MSARMNINQLGLEIIKKFEGFRAKTYTCPAGVSTIGYGTTGDRVKWEMTISREMAEKWLKEDCDRFEKDIAALVAVPLSSNQFSALVSFVYNIGTGAFADSTLLRKLNAKQYQSASTEFDRWVKGGGRPLPGLVRRRNAEEALFLKPDAVVAQEQGQKPIMFNRIAIIKETFLKKETYSHAFSEEGKTKIKLFPGTELPILAAKKEDGHTFFTLDGLQFCGFNSWYIWDDHFKFVSPPEPEDTKPDTLADHVAACCEEQGYPLDKNMWNLIGISGLYPTDRDTAYGRSIEPDRFNDSIGIISWKNNDWDMECLFQATTEPGTYWVQNPMNPEGCAVLDFGHQPGLWDFGIHRTYPALVQAGAARLRRTHDLKFRDDPVTVESNRGVNLHTTSSSFQGDSVGKWSAGCCVVKKYSDFQELLGILRKSPQYKKDKSCAFDFRLLPANWLG